MHAASKISPASHLIDLISADEMYGICNGLYFSCFRSPRPQRVLFKNEAWKWYWCLQKIVSIWFSFCSGRPYIDCLLPYLFSGLTLCLNMDMLLIYTISGRSKFYGKVLYRSVRKVQCGMLDSCVFHCFTCVWRKLVYIFTSLHLFLTCAFHTVIYIYIYIFSINFQVTIAFLAIWLVDAARLSGDSYWLPSNYNIFSKWVFQSGYYHERRY